MKKAVITLKEYQGFQRAYDFFNRELFADTLPQVLVTLQRHANTRGYFSPERFNGRIERQTVHELALNPDTFTGRTDAMILSTLTHEMAHVWQETYGEPSRRGYHNRQWASKMCEIGLQPTTTGEEGGKETGQAVTHYIIPEGRFVRAYAKLSATGFHSILKFFQVDITGVVRMTSCARYFKEGVGSSRPNWRWIMCFLECPKANTSCNACVKRLSLS